jgi:hypothetical protein
MDAGGAADVEESLHDRSGSLRFFNRAIVAGVGKSL